MARFIIQPNLVTSDFKDLGDKIKKDLEKKEDRDVPLNDIAFYVDYAQRIKAMNVREMFTARAPVLATFNAESYLFADLTGQLGRKKKSFPLNDYQRQIILDLMRAEWEESQRQQEAEQERFNALTPREKQAEVDALLGELAQDPGFMALRINNREEE